MKKYEQLSHKQRYTIECLLRKGFKQIRIAEIIGVHKSTISRELRRNTPSRGKGAGTYIAGRAHSKTEKRHKSKDKKKHLEAWHLKYIRDKLITQRWSPEYICQRGRLEHGSFVSHETIYNYIWMCKKSKKAELLADRDLHKYLRHHNRRQKRKKNKQNKGCIKNRVSIEKRPKVVNERKRKGDYEVDLMMGSNHKPGLIVLTDRNTIETKLIKITNKKAEEIAKKIIQKMERENTAIHTLTFDNDLAFAEHQKIALLLQAKTYFTRPYTSQDKGTVENRIGVIRRFFPKGTDMIKVHHNTIRSVEEKLNNRPLRKFNYLTPLEKKKGLKKVALIT